MKENYDVSELVYDLRRDSSQATGAPSDIEGPKSENFRDFGTLTKYMQTWVESYGCNEDESSKAIDYLKKIHDQIPEPDCLRDVRWSIDSMKFDNMYSYGAGNRIDFSALRGVVGLFGKNRTGKSSIPGALMYGLYNGSDRGAIKNVHIINARKDHCKVSVDFTVNGTKYRVERQSAKKVTKLGDEHAITHMNCFQLDANGEILKDMSEEQRRETEKIVRSLIGTADDFLLTSFASQGEMNTFIKQRATSRKAILTSFLDFKIFDELYQTARQDLTALKGKLSEVRRRDFGTVEREKNIELTSLDIELKQYSLEKDSANIKLSSIQNMLSQLPSEIVTQSDVSAQHQKIEDGKQKIIDIIKDKENFLKLWREKKEKVEDLRNVIANSDLDGLKNKELEAADIQRKITDLQRELKLIDQKIASLDDPGFLRGCKCLNEAETALSQKPGVEGQITYLSQGYEDLDPTTLQDKIKKIDIIRKKTEAIERDVKSSIARSGIYDEKIKIAEDRSQLNQDRLEKMLKHVSDDPKNDKLDELKVEKRELERSIRKLDSQCISLAKSIGGLQNEMQQLQIEHKKFEELNSEWKVVEMVSEAVSKKGIPLAVLGRKLPQVNTEIAQILQGCTGFTVELEADQDSNAMDVYINYGDSRRIIECASGMEKMMASLAIRVALMNLTTLPRCDLLIIDEGFGALDENNVEACNGLLHNLKKWFKSILVISHVDAVKDSVDNIIEISKKGQDSYVNMS
tara:strand:+ start:27 stop:2258 length:2232 start_codon:yes stop_codon:yes gene_type:complete